MPDLLIKLPEHELPGPGEIAEITENGFLILIENVNPPEREKQSSTIAPGTLVKYVPVDVTAPNSVVRHAAAGHQRNTRTRVAPFTVRDKSGTRAVRRRRDSEPLTNVTCAQCRRFLTEEGLLAD
jgi:hypothetical protein